MRLQRVDERVDLGMGEEAFAAHARRLELRDDPTRVHDEVTASERSAKHHPEVGELALHLCARRVLRETCRDERMHQTGVDGGERGSCAHRRRLVDDAQEVPELALVVVDRR